MYTVLHKGKGGIQHEANATTTIKPGVLLSRAQAGGVDTCSPLGAGLVPEGVARDITEMGRGIDNPYAAGERVKILSLQPGEQLVGRVPANATAIVYGDDLQSDANGYLVKATTGKKVGKARSAAPNNAGAEQFIIWEVPNVSSA